MATSFTQGQVAQFYQALCSQDASLVEMMARAAVESAADVRCDMWADMEEGTPTPDVTSIREMALGFTDDMFSDFLKQFTTAVTEAKFELRLRLRHHTTFLG